MSCPLSSFARVFQRMSLPGAIRALCLPARNTR
jgi:hypothetical protein